MCINKKRHQRLVISKEKDMIRKMKNKTKMTIYAKKKRQKIKNWCNIFDVISKEKDMVKNVAKKERQK